MANTRELRRRIRSVKNTSQITKAMQMVAATKMRKAQLQAENGKPYTETLHQSLQRLAQKVNPELNPLFRENDSNKIGVILLSTDKGLVGALNTNLLRTVQQFVSGSFRHPRPDRGSNNDDSKMDSRLRGNDSVIFYTLGRKGRQFVAKTGKDLEADFENQEVVTFRQAKQLANLIIKSFLDKQIKEAYLVYPSFISTLRQEPKVMKLLPINSNEMLKELGDKRHYEVRDESSKAHSGNERSEDSRIKPSNDSGQARMTDTSSEFLFEPNTESLLDFVLKHSIETKIYQALLETKASEHSARMISMQNATDNAKELVSDLTLTYNQTRQDAITRELLEITTAQLALE